MTAYKQGDKIEYRWDGATWKPLGSYLATSDDGSVICQKEDGQVAYVHGDMQTRLAPDTITVTVEIDRAGAKAIAAVKVNPAGDSLPGRHQAFQAFIDAVTEAVES